MGRASPNADDFWDGQERAQYNDCLAAFMKITWSNAIFFLAPAASFLITILCVPLVRRLAARWGCVALPKKERWHTRPTPTLGGLAFFLGFFAAVLIAVAESRISLALLHHCHADVCRGILR